MGMDRGRYLLVLIAKLISITSVSYIIVHSWTVYKLGKRCKDFIIDYNVKIKKIHDKHIDLYQYINQSDHSFQYRMGYLSRLSLHYIYRSNLNYWVKGMNIYWLLGVSFVSYMIAVVGLFHIFSSLFPSLMIGGYFLLCPFVIIEWICRRNSLKIRQQYTHFISYLHRWVLINDNILYGIEKTLESDIGQPLASYLKAFLHQVRLGMDIGEALELLRIKANNEWFSIFIYNLQQVLRSRGDVVCLIANLEKEAYKLEEEFTRRKVSTYKERLVVNITFFMILLVGYYMLKSNPIVAQFYLDTILGRNLMTFFSFLLFVAYVVNLKIRNGFE